MVRIYWKISYHIINVWYLIMWKIDKWTCGWRSESDKVIINFHTYSSGAFDLIKTLSYSVSFFCVCSFYALNTKQCSFDVISVNGWMCLDTNNLVTFWHEIMKKDLKFNDLTISQKRTSELKMKKKHNSILHFTIRKKLQENCDCEFVFLQASNKEIEKIWN